MTPTEIAELLKTETDRVEWKQSAKDPGEIYHAVCALANDLRGTGRPGYLLAYVTKTGKVMGTEAITGGDLDAELRTLSERLRSVKLMPTPSFDIAHEDADGKKILVVKVYPSPVPPIVTVDGVAWVRVGSTTVRARDADLARLRERRPRQNLPFDLRPLDGADLGDLDTADLEREHASQRALDADAESFPALGAWLTRRQLGEEVGGVWRPNAAAILLHGKSPQSLFPGAVVELVRYRGVDVDADVAWRKPATGTLSDQLDTLFAQIDANVTAVPLPPDGVKDAFVSEYPIEALKELVRNLVQHRLYEGTNAPARIEWCDDRIELSNPGGPFGRASEGEFGTHSDYRNPIITAGLVEQGYVQQLGRGVRRAKNLLAKAGNPPLEVATDGFTRVTVRRHP